MRMCRRPTTILVEHVGLEPLSIICGAFCAAFLAQACAVRCQPRPVVQRYRV